MGKALFAVGFAVAGLWTLTTAARAAPTYWIAQAELLEAKTDEGNLALTAGNRQGEFITSRPACEKTKAAMLAAAKKNGLKVVVRCIATTHPTSFQ